MLNGLAQKGYISLVAVLILIAGTLAGWLPWVSFGGTVGVLCGIMILEDAYFLFVQKNHALGRTIVFPVVVFVSSREA